MSVTASQLRLQGGVSTSSAQSAFLAGSSRLPVRPSRAAVACRPARLAVHAGNDYETGVFSPLVVAVRNVMGVKEFNQFRGKAISLHSQVRTHAPRHTRRTATRPATARRPCPAFHGPDGARREAGSC